ESGPHAPASAPPSRTPKPTGAWCWRAATDTDIGRPTAPRRGRDRHPIATRRTHVRLRGRTPAIAALLTIFLTARPVAHAQDEPPMIHMTPDEVRWADSAEVPGLRIAVLAGDPRQAGPHPEVAFARGAHPPETNSPSVNLRRRLGPLVEALSDATRRPWGQGA